MESWLPEEQHVLLVNAVIYFALLPDVGTDTETKLWEYVQLCNHRYHLSYVWRAQSNGKVESVY